MKNPFVWAAAALAVAALPAVAPAQEQDPQAIADSLQYQSGTIPLGDNLATLTLTPAFRYLDESNTRKVLVDLWGNPPEAVGKTLGAIVPAELGVLDEGSWLIIVSYEDSGHVNDGDAADIDYAALLKDMQQTTLDGNEDRIKQGYEKIELVGWAEPPHYDSQAKKIYWAKQLKFGDAPSPDTLNYNIRVLGRAGFLDLTAVASMTQLPMLNQRAPEILGTVAFNPGNRYDEYQEGIDKVAEYGIAGLIAGGVLAKAGFFKLLLGVLAAGWKFVLAGVAIVGGAIIRFFRGKRSA